MKSTLKQGDIYWVDLDPTLGHEQSGYRPVLIISTTMFNQASKLPVILPITNGGAFAKKLGFAVTLDSSLKTQGIIRCDQPRTLDFSQRDCKFIESIDEETLNEVLARFLPIFEI